MLQLQELKVSYGKEPDAVLKKVNLDLGDKEKIVIVGPNGSGKSTLFKAVIGLVQIQAGSVRVFGTEVGCEKGDVRVSTNLAEVYRLAYVPIRDIVRIFADLKSGNPDTAFQMFHEFELDSILKKRVHELSTGARARRLVDVLRNFESEIIIITHEFNLLPKLGEWGLYFMLEGKLWGNFSVSELDRLYITKGEAKDAVKVMDTSLGKLSVTLDHGDILVKTASNVNTLLEQV